MQFFPGRNAYLLVALVIVVDAVWLLGSPNISLPPAQLVLPALEIAALILLSKAMEGRRFSSAALERLSGKLVILLQGAAFLSMAWIAIRVLNYVSMSTSYPYADKILSSWDRFLPLDWVGYFHFVQVHPVLRIMLDNSYTSLSAVSCAGFFLLILNRDLRRVRFFLECFMATALICMAIGIFLPAIGSVATYFGDVSHIAHFKSIPGEYFVEGLRAVRSDRSVTLDIYNLPGLTAFPSFHTAAGVVLLVSFWRTSFFPAVLAYVAVMTASIPVFGGHYFVDMIAGMAVAILTCSVFAALPAYKGVLAARDEGRWGEAYAGSLS